MSYSERIYRFLCEQFKKNQAVLISSFTVGLVTFFFCFSNKLETMDDLCCIFSQGSTVASGRWGLDLAAYFLPSASIPWLNGILSILLLSITICIIIQMFEIRNRLLAVLLAAVMISFPTQTCTFGYMFTAVPYALALLLSVIAAWLLSQSLSGKNIALALFLMVWSLSMYQVYIAVTASLLVVYSFSETLSDRKSGSQILKNGFGYILFLLVSMGGYYGLTSLINHLCGISLNGYAENNLNGIGDILFGIRVSYTSFVGYFYKEYYDLVSTDASKVAHALMVLLTAGCFCVHFLKRQHRKDGKFWIALLCLFLLPPAVNCIRIISSLFHNLMLFSFTSVYVLTAVVLERCGKQLPGKWLLCAKDVIALVLVIILGTNVYFANSVYLKMYMQFQQAEAFYTSVLANLMKEPDFKTDTLLCFVGDNHIFYDIPLVDTEQQAGIREGIIGTYSQDSFIRCYLGVDLNVAGWDVTDILKEDSRVIAMPSYPAYGSIQKIDDCFVIKLG